MGTSETTADTTVRAFCAAWERMDLDEMMAFFTDDAVYHNIPMAPMEGAAAIREGLAGMGSIMSGIRFEIHRQAVNGSVVMNERTDHITMGERTIALPVMGVFELEGDKIKAWRDYFDMAQFAGA
jgi:limonene-1,2-epoxide hydrolase